MISPSHENDNLFITYLFFETNFAIAISSLEKYRFYVPLLCPLKRHRYVIIISIYYTISPSMQYTPYALSPHNYEYILIPLVTFLHPTLYILMIPSVTFSYPSMSVSSRYSLASDIHKHYSITLSTLTATSSSQLNVTHFTSRI